MSQMTNENKFKTSQNDYSIAYDPFDLLIRNKPDWEGFGSHQSVVTHSRI